MQVKLADKEMDQLNIYHLLMRRHIWLFSILYSFISIIKYNYFLDARVNSTHSSPIALDGQWQNFSFPFSVTQIRGCTNLALTMAKTPGACTPWGAAGSLFCICKGDLCNDESLQWSLRVKTRWNGRVDLGHCIYWLEQLKDGTPS